MNLSELIQQMKDRPKRFAFVLGHNVVTPPIIRFWDKIEIQESGCWEWQAQVKDTGYGIFYDGKHQVRAHRYAYEHFNNVSVPEGLEIDHLCRNRKCVNPEHMEIVTHQENVVRGIAGQWFREKQIAKTHCPQGHPYDEENTYHRPDGGRDCKQCMRKRSNQWKREHLTNLLSK